MTRQRPDPWTKVPIPHDARVDTRMSDGAFRMYMNLLAYREVGLPLPNVRECAEDCDVNVRTIIRYRKELIKLGYLERGPESYVYVISGGGYCKIGVSNNPERRLARLQTGNPHELILIRKYYTLDAKTLEATLHETLEEYRVRGEWFKLPLDRFQWLLEELS